MTESLHLPDDSDRYAAEVFDAQRAEILAFFLVGICEDPLDRVRIMLSRQNASKYSNTFSLTSFANIDNTNIDESPRDLGVNICKKCFGVKDLGTATRTRGGST